MWLQELKEVSRASKSDSGIDLKPDENNIYAWKGLLQVCCKYRWPQLVIKGAPGQTIPHDMLVELAGTQRHTF